MINRFGHFQEKREDDDEMPPYIDALHQNKKNKSLDIGTTPKGGGAFKIDVNGKGSFFVQAGRHVASKDFNYELTDPKYGMNGKKLSGDELLDFIAGYKK